MKKKEERIIIIGDIHGESTWMDIVEKHPGCKYIFLGDYCDPYRYDLSDEDVIANLCSIIEFKKQEPDNVVLLLGNHDIQYLYHEAERCSRRMEKAETQIRDLLNANISLFQWGEKVEKIVFTHAGISQGWFRFASDKADKGDILKFITAPENKEIAFSCGYYRGGVAPHSGFFWADRRELDEPLPGYVQVVGHSRVHEIIFKKGREGGIVFFCDSLWNGIYLIIENTLESFVFFTANIADDTKENIFGLSKERMNEGIKLLEANSEFRDEILAFKPQELLNGCK